MIAGRFRVERVVAEGGFGVVYRAQQVALDRAVAIKVLKTEGDLRSRALQRAFEAEARTIARLKHPHIVEIHDFGVSEIAGGGRPLFWMAMEWLEGRTLEQVLAARRGQPLTPVEALDLLRPVLRAIGFAHQQRVAHRDLKPGNIVLAEEGGTAILKVLDFGIAKMMASVDHAGEAASRTTQELPAFSPDYAAPEQVVRAPTGPWTDVHALGLILAEMLTGRSPYGTGDAPLVQAMALTRPTPGSKGVVVGPWEPILARALAILPEDRYRDAGVLLEALERALPAPTAEARARASTGRAAVEEVARFRAAATVLEPRSQRARLARRLAAAAAALVVVAGGVWGTAALVRRHRDGAATVAPPSPAQVHVRRSVAVFGFHDRTRGREHAWMGTALAQVFGADLGSGAELRPVAADRVAQARRELRLEELGGSDAAGQLRALRTNLRCDLVLFGSFAAVAGAAGAVEVDVVLKDASTGDSVTSFTERGVLTDLYELATRAGARLRVALGITPSSPEQQRAVRASLPASPAAARLYAQGLFELHRSRFVEARALLEKAVAEEPDFPLAHAALAQALDATLAEAPARRAARRALDLAGALPREEQLLVKAQHHFAARELDQAIAAYGALHAFFPDNLDYGIRKARTEMFAGRPLEALRTTAALRALPPAISDDPRIDVEEARALHGTSRYQECLTVCERATAVARQRQNWSVVARVGYFHGISLQELGRRAEGLRVLEEANTVARQMGDFGLSGVIVTPLARGHAARGELARARRELEDAERSLTDIGSLYYAASSSEALARFDLEDGDLPRAHSRVVASIQRYRAEDSQHALSTGLAHLARLATLMSDFTGAAAAADEALAASQKLGRTNATMGALLVKAFLAHKRGDLAGEAALDERALALASATTNPAGRARVLLVQSERLRLAGDLAGARARFDEALALEKPLDDVYQSARTALVGVALAIAEGRGAQAASEARARFQELEKMGAWSAALEALALEVEALARAGGQTAAQLLERQGGIDARLAARTSFAVARAAGDPAASRGAGEGERALEQIAQEARRAGFLDRAILADLAWVEARRRRGGDARPDRRIDQRLAVARQHGFAPHAE